MYDFASIESIFGWKVDGNWVTPIVRVSLDWTLLLRKTNINDIKIFMYNFMV